MSGAGTERAERELEADSGCVRARAPRERAWPAAARSLRRAGGEGEGQVSVCGPRAPARGFYSTHPPPDPAPACGRWPRFPGHPLGRPVLPALPLFSSALYLDLPLAEPPLWGYCFRVRVTYGESRAWLGTRPCPLAMLLSRTGDPPGSCRPGKAPRSFLPKGNVSPSCPPLRASHLSGPICPNIQTPSHPAPTFSSLRVPHVPPATGRGIA